MDCETARAAGFLREAATCSLAALISIGAWGGELDERRAFEIQPQPMETALIQFSQQASLQVIANSAVVAQVKSKGVHGSLPVKEALAALLEGTGLSWRRLGPDTIAIDGPGTPEPRDKAASAAADCPASASRRCSAGGGHRGGRALGQRRAGRHGESGNGDDHRLAAAARRCRGCRAGEDDQGGRDRAQRQSTIAQVLNSLPEVSVGFTESINEGEFGATTVQLHGMPAGTTLILLNGRRLESGGSNLGKFFDLNSIPVGLIDRIEVLPMGSSAIYGSDGLAGVVNIILKKDFTGRRPTSVTAAPRARPSRVSTSPGARHGDGLRSRWSARCCSAAGCSSASAPSRATTTIAVSAGPTCAGRSATPATIYSTDGSNLPGLSSPFAAIPPGLTGVPSISDFAATQGVEKPLQLLRNYWAIPASDRAAGDGELSLELWRLAAPVRRVHLFAA
jgi:iron complex outermembrane receptor protein